MVYSYSQVYAYYDGAYMTSYLNYRSVVATTKMSSLTITKMIKDNTNIAGVCVCDGSSVAMAEDKLPSQDVHKRTSFLQRPSETMTKRTSTKSVGSFYSLGCPIE